MKAKQNTATLRSKRQLTLPKEVCEALGLRAGDKLALEVQDGVLIAKPGPKAVLDALEAIAEALRRAGVTEQELLESGRQVREELFREKYGHLFEKRGVRRRRRSA